MVELKVEKSADRNYVFFGISNVIKYSIIITNIGDTKATCVKVKDIISKGAYFVKGSFNINGCKQDISNLEKCISIGSINPGANILVNYEMEVVKYNPPTELVNQAMATYCDETGNIVTVASNILKTPVINIKVNACKTVDKTVAKIGEVISYSVVVRNNSNILIDNVVFYDNLPDSVEVLPSSVLVNLQPQYLENFDGGLPLGTLNAYASVVISFQVRIVSLKDPPIIENIGRVEFEYTISDGGILVVSVGETCSNKVVTRVINKTITC